MNRLAIFDIDGTLTDTNGVDDECYRISVAEAMEMPAEAIDWAGALHVTDSAIFQWLWKTHGRSGPSDEAMVRARSTFIARLATALESEPSRFTEIGGAAAMLEQLSARRWHVALATGGWGPSAKLKLGAAKIVVEDTLIACADDALSRADIVRLARRRAEARYGCRFDRVVSIGDGVWDVQTASSLDLPFVGIGQSERAARLRDAGADVVLPNYRDFAAFERAIDSATTPRSIVAAQHG